MTILVTGFEAFGGYKVNPTEQLAHVYHGKHIENERVEGRIIKLEYNTIRAQIRALIDKLDPSYIFLLGQAPRPAISLEKIAINLVNVK